MIAPVSFNIQTFFLKPCAAQGIIGLFSELDEAYFISGGVGLPKVETPMKPHIPEDVSFFGKNGSYDLGKLFICGKVAWKIYSYSD